MKETKLTAAERRVALLLADAWNAWLRLPDRNAISDSEFMRAIHDAQARVALRVAKRGDPEFWR